MDKNFKKKRYFEIISILEENKKPMTAKQIAVSMFEHGYIPTTERNFAHPRLVELVDKQIVGTCLDKITCEYTGKKVSQYYLLLPKQNKI